MSRKGTKLLNTSKNTISKILGVAKYNSQGCLEHVTNYNKYYNGYSRICYKGKVYFGHRLIYTWTVGEIPKDKIILHTCDNPCCINPNHLSLGTFKDNMDDMRNKGRARWSAKGETNSQAIFSEEIVKEIIKLIPKLSRKEIQGIYKISKGTLQKIAVGTTWKHLERNYQYAPRRNNL